MQTFLPYADFTKSAKALDNKRLGKQRGECKQILRALGVQIGPDPLSIHYYGWRNHPAVKMWRGSEIELLWYGMVVCDEWVRRGYNDNVKQQFWEAYRKCTPEQIAQTPAPSWLGSEKFHLSHKSNLIRKLPEHYGPMWPDVPDNLPYVWPV